MRVDMMERPGVIDLSSALDLDAKQFDQLVEAVGGLSDEELQQVADDADALSALIESKGAPASVVRAFARACLFLAEGVALGITETETIIRLLRPADVIIETDDEKQRLEQLMPIATRLSTRFEERRHRFRYMEGLMPNFDRVRVGADLRFIPARSESAAAVAEERGQGEQFIPIGIIRIEHDESPTPLIFQVTLESLRELQAALEDLHHSLESLAVQAKGGELG